MITHADLKNFWQLPETERQKLRIAVEMQEVPPAPDENEAGEECPNCGHDSLERIGSTRYQCPKCKIEALECSACGELYDPRESNSSRHCGLCEDFFTEVSE
jgi:hypothetical protein